MSALSWGLFLIYYFHLKTHIIIFFYINMQYFPKENNIDITVSLADISRNYCH